MANPYYTNSTTLIAGQIARASDVESKFDEIEAAFETLNSATYLLNAIRLTNVDAGTVALSENAASRAGKFIGFDSNGDIQLDESVPIDSPTFTGTPAAPTAVAGTDTTQIATTEFVQAALGKKVYQAGAESVHTTPWNLGNGVWANAGTAKSIAAQSDTSKLYVVAGFDVIIKRTTSGTSAGHMRLAYYDGSVYTGIGDYAYNSYALGGVTSTTVRTYVTVHVELSQSHRNGANWTLRPLGMRQSSGDTSTCEGWYFTYIEVEA